MATRPPHQRAQPCIRGVDPRHSPQTQRVADSGREPLQPGGWPGGTGERSMKTYRPRHGPCEEPGGAQQPQERGQGFPFCASQAPGGKASPFTPASATTTGGPTTVWAPASSATPSGGSESDTAVDRAANPGRAANSDCAANPPTPPPAESQAAPPREPARRQGPSATGRGRLPAASRAAGPPRPPAQGDREGQLRGADLQHDIDHCHSSRILRSLSISSCGSRSASSSCVMIGTTDPSVIRCARTSSWSLAYSSRLGTGENR